MSEEGGSNSDLRSAIPMIQPSAPSPHDLHFDAPANSVPCELLKRPTKLLRKRRRGNESSDEDGVPIDVAAKTAELREEQKVRLALPFPHSIRKWSSILIMQLRTRSYGLKVDVLNKLGTEFLAAPKAVAATAENDTAAKSILGSGFTGQVGSDVRVEDALVQVMLYIL